VRMAFAKRGLPVVPRTRLLQVTAVALAEASDGGWQVRGSLQREIAVNPELAEHVFLKSFVNAVAIRMLIAL
jgi:hypothetical protein